MPKKTKKHKIKAELRRKMFLQKQSNLSQNNEKTLKISTKKTEEQQDVTTYSNEEGSDYYFFKRDFIKSILIIVFIIALEIVVYFGTII